MYLIEINHRENQNIKRYVWELIDDSFIYTEVLSKAKIFTEQEVKDFISEWQPKYKKTTFLKVEL